MPQFSIHDVIGHERFEALDEDGKLKAIDKYYEQAADELVRKRFIEDTYAGVSDTTGFEPADMMKLRDLREKAAGYALITKPIGNEMIAHASKRNPGISLEEAAKIAMSNFPKLSLSDEELGALDFTAPRPNMSPSDTSMQKWLMEKPGIRSTLSEKEGKRLFQTVGESLPEGAVESYRKMAQKLAPRARIDDTFDIDGKMRVFISENNNIRKNEVVLRFVDSANMVPVTGKRARLIRERGTRNLVESKGKVGKEAPREFKFSVDRDEYLKDPKRVITDQFKNLPKGNALTGSLDAPKSLIGGGLKNISDFLRVIPSISGDRPPTPSEEEDGTAGFQNMGAGRVIKSDTNDADSFRIEMADGSAQTFRLYFADAAESSLAYPEQVKKQGMRFGGLSPTQVVELGKKAKAKAEEWMANERFEVITRFEPVENSDRMYAAIRFPDAPEGRQLLHERLIEDGYATETSKGTTFEVGTAAVVDKKQKSGLLATMARGLENVGTSLQESRTAMSRVASQSPNLLTRLPSLFPETLGQMIPSLISGGTVGVLTKSKKLAAGGAALFNFPMEFEASLRKAEAAGGKDHARNVMAAGLAATLATTIETVADIKILETVAGSAYRNLGNKGRLSMALRQTGYGMAREGGTEIAQEMVSNGVLNRMISKDIGITDGAMESLIVGSLVGGFISGTIGANEVARGHQLERIKQKRRLPGTSNLLEDAVDAETRSEVERLMDPEGGEGAAVDVPTFADNNQAINHALAQEMVNLGLMSRSEVPTNPEDIPAAIDAKLEELDPDGMMNREALEVALTGQQDLDQDVLDALFALDPTPEQVELARTIVAERQEAVQGEIDQLQQETLPPPPPDWTTWEPAAPGPAVEDAGSTPAPSTTFLQQATEGLAQLQGRARATQDQTQAAPAGIPEGDAQSLAAAFPTTTNAQEQTTPQEQPQALEVSEESGEGGTVAPSLPAPRRPAAIKRSSRGERIERDIRRERASGVSPLIGDLPGKEAVPPGIGRSVTVESVPLTPEEELQVSRYRGEGITDMQEQVRTRKAQIHNLRRKGDPAARKQAIKDLQKDVAALTEEIKLRRTLSRPRTTTEAPSKPVASAKQGPAQRRRDAPKIRGTARDRVDRFFEVSDFSELEPNEFRQVLDQQMLARQKDFTYDPEARTISFEGQVVHENVEPSVAQKLIDFELRGTEVGALGLQQVDEFVGESETGPSRKVGKEDARGRGTNSYIRQWALDSYWRNRNAGRAATTKTGRRNLSEIDKVGQRLVDYFKGGEQRRAARGEDAEIGWAERMGKYAEQVEQASNRVASEYNRMAEGTDAPALTAEDVTAAYYALLNDYWSGSRYPTLDQRVFDQAAANALFDINPIASVAFSTAPGDPRVFANQWNNPDPDGPKAVAYRPVEKRTGLTGWRPAQEMVESTDPAFWDGLTRDEQMVYGTLWEIRRAEWERGGLSMGEMLTMDQAVSMAKRRVTPYLTSEQDFNQSLESLSQVLENSSPEISKEIFLSPDQFEILEEQMARVDQFLEFGSLANLDALDKVRERLGGIGDVNRQAKADATGTGDIMSKAKGNNYNGAKLADDIAARAKSPVIKKLLAALKKAVPLENVRVKAGSVRMNKSAQAFTQRGADGTVDISINENALLTPGTLHLLTEELIHSASLLANVDVQAAAQMILKAYTKLPSKLTKLQPHKMTADDLHQAYVDGKINASEYRVLYALQGPQEALAHSMITPAFQAFLDRAKIPYSTMIEEAFGSDVADLSREFAKEAASARKARGIQDNARHMAGRPPRSARTEENAATKEEIERFRKALESPNPIAFYEENKEHVAWGRRVDHTPSQRTLFQKRFTQMIPVLLRMDVSGLPNAAIFKQRQKMALASLFNPEVSPSYAWNFALEIKAFERARDAGATIDATMDLEDLGGRLKSAAAGLSSTDAAAGIVTDSVKGVRIVRDLLSSFERGDQEFSLELSDRGRNAHQSNRDRFEAREEALRKPLGKNYEEQARGTMRAIMANQIVSMPSKREMEKAARELHGPLATDREIAIAVKQMERDALKHNLQSIETSIDNKRNSAANPMDRHNEAVVEAEMLNEGDKALRRIANAKDFDDAVRIMRSVLTPQQEAYRKGMVAEFAKLRDDMRFEAEANRNIPWEDIREYMPFIVDDPANVLFSPKASGPGISAQTPADHLNYSGSIGNDGEMGVIDVGTVIPSAVMRRSGLDPKKFHYYRTFVPSTLIQAYLSQSYETTTHFERKILNYITAEPRGDTASRFPSLIAKVDGKHPSKSRHAVAAATKAHALKFNRSDRQGLSSHLLMRAMRTFSKVAFARNLGGLVQPLIQVSGAFTGWIGETLPSADRVMRIRALFEGMRQTGPFMGNEVFDTFLQKHASQFWNRVPESNRELFHREARRLKAAGVKGKGEMAARSIRAVLTAFDTYFSAVTEWWVAKPEKAALRPILYAEYKMNAIKNGTITNMSDDSVFTTNVDIKALDDALRTIDRIAAPSDPAQRGEYYIPQGRDATAEAARVLFLAYNGHQSQMASNMVLGHLHAKEGEWEQAFKLYGNSIMQGMFYAALYTFMIRATQDWLQIAALNLTQLFGFDTEEEEEQVRNRMKTREEATLTQRILAAAYTGIDDAIIPMAPIFGPALATPLGTALANSQIDRLMRSVREKSDFWDSPENRLSFEYNGKINEVTVEASKGGPGLELIANIVNSEAFDVNPFEPYVWAFLVGQFIPERAFSKGFIRGAEAQAKAVEKERQEDE